MGGWEGHDNENIQFGFSCLDFQVCAEPIVFGLSKLGGTHYFEILPTNTCSALMSAVSIDRAPTRMVLAKIHVIAESGLEYGVCFWTSLHTTQSG